MSQTFYMISRFKDTDALNDREWDNISNFIDKFGIENINDYLVIENNFIEFLMMFYNMFSNEPKKYTGYGCLASHVILNEDDFNSPHVYYNLGDDVDKRLRYLSRLNLNHISEEDLKFLLTCWIRQLCFLYWFDIVSGSFIRSTDADLCFILMLHEKFKVEDIFQPLEHVHFLEMPDPLL